MMTGIQILENIGFAFNYALENTFYTILALLIIYAVILSLYHLIIKR